MLVLGGVSQLLTVSSGDWRPRKVPEHAHRSAASFGIQQAESLDPLDQVFA
jgi:hypothetical protein